MNRQLINRICIVSVCLACITIGIRSFGEYTLAYFTDVIVNKGNIITSANLSFAMMYVDEDGNSHDCVESGDTDKETPIISGDELNLVITNTGDATLKLRVRVGNEEYVYVENLGKGSTENLSCNISTLPADNFTVVAEYAFNSAQGDGGYVGKSYEYQFTKIEEIIELKDENLLGEEKLEEQIEEEDGDELKEGAEDGGDDSVIEKEENLGDIVDTESSEIPDKNPTQDGTTVPVQDITTSNGINESNKIPIEGKGDK